MATIALSRRALRDLDEIKRFSVERWGQVVADEYMRSIEQALVLLGEQPGLLRARPDVSESLAFYRVKQHFLVCALEKENLFVLTVIHGAMDLPERMSELEPALQQEADILHRALLARRRWGDLGVPDTSGTPSGNRDLGGDLGVPDPSGNRALLARRRR